MPKTDREVFDHLCNRDDLVGEEIGFLAYAIYAQEKYEWATEHFQNGHAPSETDLNRWVADITPSRFAKMREAAAQLFDEAAHRYLQPQIELQKEQAVRGVYFGRSQGSRIFFQTINLSDNNWRSNTADNRRCHSRCCGILEICPHAD
jgi:hypothetical protein